jgi:hypothetical protein
MFKRVLVVMVVVAGCQGPESFRAGFTGVGGGGGNGVGSGGIGVLTGAAGSTGGVGILPIMTSGTAGDGGLVGGAAGDTTSGAAGSTGVAGGAAATAGAAGTVSPTGGGSGASAAGAPGAAGATVVDAGAGAAGRAVDVDAGAHDAAPPPPTSVAYSSATWKLTASITAAGADSVPSNACDGKLATRWTTGRAQMGGETFVVDLGKTEPVSRVVLDDTTNPQDFPIAYSLEISTDGMTFTPVKTGKGATTTDIQFDRVNTRYIRLRQTGTAGAAGSWWSIDELQISS